MHDFDPDCSKYAEHLGDDPGRVTLWRGYDPDLTRFADVLGDPADYFLDPDPSRPHPLVVRCSDGQPCHQLTPEGLAPLHAPKHPRPAAVATAFTAGPGVGRFELSVTDPGA